MAVDLFPLTGKWQRHSAYPDEPGRDCVPLEKESVLVLLLVRKNPHGGGYEIIARHRRKEAALWAGLTGFDFDRREREMAGRRNVATDKDLTRDGKWKYNWIERKQQE